MKHCCSKHGVLREVFLLSVIAGLLIVVTHDSFSQLQDPQYVGELEINVVGGSATILVEAQGPAFGTQCSWYPVNADIRTWGRTNSDYYLLKFIDRYTSCSPYTLPDTPRIGYGLYKVSVGSDYIYVDFRDADYGTLTGYNGYQDMRLNHTVGTDCFSSRYDSNIELGETYHIWDMQPKQTPVKVPVKIADNLSGAFGGTVIVDGVSRNYPYETLWEAGNHTVAAAVRQYPNWVFDSWSDGGTREHTVSVNEGDFGLVLTARYIQSPMAPISGTSTSDLSSTAFPNPFNPTTLITYTLPKKAFVRLTIYDNSGRQVKEVVRGIQEPGEHLTRFDATGLSSGAYFYRLQADERILVRCVTLLK